VLRTETAGIAALALLQALAGDLARPPAGFLGNLPLEALEVRHQRTLVDHAHLAEYRHAVPEVARVVGVHHVRLRRTSCGKPWVSTAKWPPMTSECAVMPCMMTMRVRPDVRGTLRPQAASKDTSGTRRPPQATVPRYHGGWPSSGVGAW